MVWNDHVEGGFAGVRALALKMKEAVMAAHDAILAARVKQTTAANRVRRPAPFQGDFRLGGLSLDEEPQPVQELRTQAITKIY